MEKKQIAQKFKLLSDYKGKLNLGLFAAPFYWVRNILIG